MKVRECYFLVPDKKVIKETGIGAALRNAPCKLWCDCHRQSLLFGFAARSTTPMYPTSRFASQDSKMFRFLNPYNSKAERFAHCRYPKIGTFSGVGWRCGGRIFKGGAFARSAPLNWLLLVLFLPVKKRTFRHITGKYTIWYLCFLTCNFLDFVIIYMIINEEKEEFA